MVTYMKNNQKQLAEQLKQNWYLNEDNKLTHWKWQNKQRDLVK